MAKTQDFTAVWKDMMASMPMDTSAFESAFKNQAEVAEKLSTVAIEAAKQSTDLSAKWTNDTLAKVGDASKAPAEPADYAKVATDFASTSAEAASEHVAAFAEIARKVQAQTIELMMAAGKEASEGMVSATQKAAETATAAAKKAVN